jgi:hypothetical protein
MTPQVFIFIGPICSGKSTKAKEAAANGCIVINDDAIVAMCHGGLYGSYSKSLKHLYKSIEMGMLNSALSLGRDVIVDRPNMGRLARARFIAAAKSLDASVHGVLFPNEGPRIHAQRRHQHDSRGLDLEHWVRAAHRHQEMWEHPTYQEGFDSIAPAESLVW